MISINTLVEKIHKLLENTELDNLNNLSSNVKSRLFMVDYSEKKIDNVEFENKIKDLNSENPEEFINIETEEDLLEQLEDLHDDLKNELEELDSEETEETEETAETEETVETVENENIDASTDTSTQNNDVEEAEYVDLSNVDTSETQENTTTVEDAQKENVKQAEKQESQPQKQDISQQTQNTQKVQNAAQSQETTSTSTSEEIDSTNQEIQQLETQKQETESDLTQQESNYQQTETQMNNELSQIDTEIQTEEGNLDGANQELDTANQAVDAAQADVNAAQQEVDSSQQEVDSTESQLDSAVQATNAAQAEEQTTCAANQAAKAAETQAADESTQANNELSSATDAANTASDIHEGTSADLAQAVGETKAATAIRIQKDSEVSSAQSEYNKAKSADAGENKSLWQRFKNWCANALNKLKSAIGARDKAKADEEAKKKEEDRKRVIDEDAAKELDNKIKEQEQAQSVADAAQVVLDKKTGEREVTDEEYAAALLTLAGAMQEQDGAQNNYNSALDTFLAANNYKLEADGTLTDAEGKQIDSAQAVQELETLVQGLNTNRTNTEASYSDTLDATAAVISCDENEINELDTRIKELKDKAAALKEKSEQEMASALLQEQMLTELSMQKGELNAAENGAGLCDDIAGLWGGGIEPQKEEYESKREKLEAAIKSGDPKDLEEAYKAIYGDVEVLVDSSGNVVTDVSSLPPEEQEKITTKTVKDLGSEQISERVVSEGKAAKEAADFTEAIQNGAFVVDGEPVTMETLNEILSQQADEKIAEMEDAIDDQGWLSTAISGVNDVLGAGTSSSDARAQLEQYKANVERLKTCTDPSEYAALYKTITGSNLDPSSMVQNLAYKQMADEANGVKKENKTTTAQVKEGQVELKDYINDCVKGVAENNGTYKDLVQKGNSKANEIVQDYKDTQKSATKAVTGTVSAIVSAVVVTVCTAAGICAAPFTAGASLGAIAAGFAIAGATGAAVNTALNASNSLYDADEDGNLDFNYSLKEGLIDAGTGFVSGVASNLGNGASGAITSKFSSTATNAVVNTTFKETCKNAAKNIGVKAIANAADGALDGAISSGGDYVFTQLSEGKKIKLDELKDAVGVGAVFGGITNVGVGGATDIFGDVTKGIKGNKFAKEINAALAGDSTDNFLANAVSKNINEEFIDETGKINKYAAAQIRQNADDSFKALKKFGLSSDEALEVIGKSSTEKQAALPTALNILSKNEEILTANGISSDNISSVAKTIDSIDVDSNGKLIGMSIADDTGNRLYLGVEKNGGLKVLGDDDLLPEPKPNADDVTPVVISDGDVLPKPDTDVKPKPDADVNPKPDTDDVTPRPNTDDVTPKPDTDDVTPVVISDGDVLPKPDTDVKPKPDADVNPKPDTDDVTPKPDTDPAEYGRKFRAEKEAAVNKYANVPFEEKIDELVMSGNMDFDLKSRIFEGGPNSIINTDLIDDIDKLYAAIKDNPIKIDNNNVSVETKIAKIRENGKFNIDSEIEKYGLSSNVIGEIDSIYKHITKMEESMQAKLDMFVPEFSDAQKAIASVNTGDVVRLEGTDKISIKMTDGTLKELKISAETYLDLFPPASKFSYNQQHIGDCYLVSSLNNMNGEAGTRHRILESFTENADGSIDAQLPNGKAKIRLEKGEKIEDLVSDWYTDEAPKGMFGKDVDLPDIIKEKKGIKEYEIYNDDPSNFLVSGPKGIKMLEHLYGVELMNDALEEVQYRQKYNARILDKATSQLEFFNELLDNPSKYNVNSTRQVMQLKKDLETAMKLEGTFEGIVDIYDVSDYVDKYLLETTPDGKMAINMDNLKLRVSNLNCTKINTIKSLGKAQEDILKLTTNNKGIPETLRSGGLQNEVYRKFGLETQTLTMNKLDIIDDESNWDKYIFGFNTKGKRDTDYFDVDRKIAQRHAYTLKFNKTASGEIEYIITNPWNTGRQIKLSREELENFGSCIEIAEIA